MRKALPLLLASLALAEGPYTLEECRRLARSHNLEVKSAQLELESASETRKATFTKYFPQVSATAGALASKDRLLSTTTPETNLPVIDPATGMTGQSAYVPSMALGTGRTAGIASLMIQQPLYAGGRVVNGNRLAKVGEEVARNKVLLAERDAVAQAEDKYWALLALQEKRRTLDAYDSLLVSLQRQVEDAVAHGLSTRNDLLKVRLKQGEVRIRRMQLESGLRLSARDLRQHLGLPEDSTLVLADSLAVPQDPAALSGWKQGAVERRVETRLLAQGVRAEELQADIEQGTMLPSVMVGADASYLKVSGFDGGTSLTVFGLVSVPISDIWSGHHSTQAHRIKVREAGLKEADTRRKIGLGVDKDWDDLVRSFQNGLLSDNAVEQAEVNLGEENDRYRNGIATASDYLEALVSRQESLDKRLEVRKDYWLARSAYLRSVAQSTDTVQP